MDFIWVYGNFMWVFPSDSHGLGPWIAGPWTSDPGALGGALGPAHGPWSLACALDAPVAALGGGWGGEDFPMGIPHG